MRIGVLAVLLLGQEDPAVWIDLLRSDRIEEREEAARRLEERGAAVVPALEKAAQGPDAERAGRAADVLRRIEIRGLLTPRMRRFLPDIEMQLKTGNAWVEVFELLAQGGRNNNWAGFVHREELLPFARKALRCMTPAQAAGLVRTLQLRRLVELAPELLDLCRSGPHQALPNAAATLAAWDPRGAVDVLRPRLQDPSMEVRLAAVRALAVIKTPDARHAVTEAMGSKDLSLRAQAARMAGVYSDEEAVPALTLLLQDREPAVRRAAISALGELRARAQSDAIAAALEDPELLVREAALRTLIDLRVEERFPDLLRHLQDMGPRRPGLLKAFGNERWTRAVPHLLHCLSDPDNRVRAAALEALGDLGAAEAAPSLIALLGHPELGNTAYRALSEIKARGHVDALLSLLDGPAEGGADRSMSLLMEMRDPAVLPGALKLLDHPQREVQLRAEAILMYLPLPEAVGKVSARLLHADPSVAAAAVQLLAGVPGREPDALLLRAAAAEAVEVRTAALRAVGQRNLADARPLLEAALQDPAGQVREAAVVGLFQLGPRGLAPRFLPLLADADEEVCSTAFRFLMSVKEESWPDLLRPALAHPMPAVRSLVLHLAQHHEARALLPDLLPLLADPDEDLRTSAACIAALWGAKESLALLLPHVKKDALPHEVLQALRTLGGPEVVRAVVEALPTAPYPMLLQFVDLLGASRCAEAVAPLKALFEKEDWTLQAEALEALHRLAPVPAEDLLRASAEHPNDHVRRGALNLLLERAPPDLAEPLLRNTARLNGNARSVVDVLPAAAVQAAALRLLADPDPRLRKFALRVLAPIGDPAAAPAVRPFLKHPDPGFREAAALALGGMRDPDAAGEFADLMKDLHPEVRSAAVRATARGGLRGSVPALLRLLDDPHEGVQSAALDALVELRAPQAIPALIERLRHSTSWRARTAMSGLAALEAKEAIPLLTELARAGPQDLAQQAAAILGWLGAKDAAPLLRELLAGSHPLRPAAAAGLALLGRPDGAALLAETPFPALNALRSPEAFRRLRGIDVPPESRNRLRTFLEYAARRAGLAFACDETLTSKQKEWLDEKWTGPLTWSSLFLPDEIVCSIVVEADTLRVTTPEEARRLQQLRWPSPAK